MVFAYCQNNESDGSKERKGRYNRGPVFYADGMTLWGQRWSHAFQENVPYN